jgi:ribosomal protein S18 acetylase RimI-like enzyme
MLRAAARPRIWPGHSEIRRTMLAAGPLVFEVTRDPELLASYFRIYEQRFREVHGAHLYRHDGEDEDDRRSDILIARVDSVCIGGARLTTKTPEQRDALPMEIAGFSVEERLPGMVGADTRYGQIGRICLMREFAGGGLTRQLLWHLYRRVVELDLAVIFGTAPIQNARSYRQHCIAMGLQGVTIHYDVVLPTYPMCDGLTFYLVSGMRP